MTVLNGHNSPETAYVVDDYPYGFKLRCKIRYWIERRKGFGMRFVSQTTNPKRPVEIWNKPKAGTYASLVVMVRDESNGYISNDAIHFSTGPENFTKFRAAYYNELTPEDQSLFDVMEKMSRKMNPISWADWDSKTQPAKVV